MNKKRKILAAFLLIVICGCMLYIGNNYSNDYQTARETKALEQKMDQQVEIQPEEVIVEESEDLSDQENSNEITENKMILSEFHELYSENSDIVGWLKIEGTSVSYPVMQNPDNNDFYLDHGFDKEENKNGLPLLDKNCNIEDPSTNLIIHGHNMKSGMIFGELMKYKEEDYFHKHPIISFNSLYETGEYEIISVFLSKVYRKSDEVFKYYQFIDAKSEEEYNEFVDNVKEMSLYEIEATARYGDQLITLSTCEYSTENGRLAIVARKIQK